MNSIHPIADDPLLHQLPSYAHPLSILLLDKERNFPYLLNDFILPAADTERGGLCNAAYDWMYIGHGAMSYECGVFPRDMLEEPEALLDFLLAMLRHGRYCLMNLDEFHCRFSNRYHREHAVGGFLINGMDTEREQISLCGYSQKGRYTQNLLSLAEFLRAIDGSSPDLIIYCLRPNRTTPSPTFDAAAFFRQIRAYADPDGPAGQPAGYVYGLAALSVFIDQIVSARKQRTAVPTGSALTLREHTVLMGARLSYLAEKGILEPEFPARFSKIRRLADDIAALATACSDTGRQPVGEFYSLAIDYRRTQTLSLLEEMEKKAIHLRREEQLFFAELERAEIREGTENA